MTEVEITRPLTLDERQGHVIEMHSVFNVLNVAMFQIDAVGQLVGDAAEADRFLDRLLAWHAALGERENALAELRRTPEIRDRLLAWLGAVRGRAQDPGDFDERVANLVSIFAVLEERVGELVARTGAPGLWVTRSFAGVRARMERAFRAIERNAFGRWRIAFSERSRPPGAYLLEIGLWSADGRTMALPAVLEDVMRDLAANSRKFTPPGGEIRVALAEEPRELLLRVADTGRGIAADELEEVVQFGRRARGQERIAHTGGGFGLTKACHVARAFGGRMWIRSAPGAGTTVTIRLPRATGPAPAPPSARA